MSSGSDNEELDHIDIDQLSYVLIESTVGLYETMLEKLGTRMAKKHLKDTTQEDINSFVNRLKESQTSKLKDELSLIFRRVMIDNLFIKSFDEVLSRNDSTDELKRRNEDADNRIQSIDDQSYNLLLEYQIGIERIEEHCHKLMEHLFVLDQNK